MIDRIILFGNDIGISQLVKHIPLEKISGIVTASIREKESEGAKRFAGVFGCSHIVQPYIPKDATVFPYAYEFGDFYDALWNLKPDLFLVHSYSMKIPQTILNIPTHGSINIHYALLPKYRGANPIQWAMINGEEYTGVTIHYMTDKIDAGDIIAQYGVPIHWTDTWKEVVKRCNVVTDFLLGRELPKIFSGTNTRSPQDERIATHYPRRTPSDGEIIWAMPTIDIYNKIRALVKPHPGAFYYNNKREKVVIDEFKSYEWVEDMQIKWWET